VTDNGATSPIAVPTTRSHTSGGWRDPNGVAEENEYKVSQGVDGGNPVCEPVYVNGAEPGDTLQVDVLQLRTAEFGWTCVRPSGITLEAPTRDTIGDDPQYDDPAGPVRAHHTRTLSVAWASPAAVRWQDDGVDAARVFIWKLHPDTREDCELTTASGRTLRVPYRPFCGVMGVAPPPDQQLEDGRPVGVVSTGPPNINGGNVRSSALGRF